MFCFQTSSVYFHHTLRDQVLCPCEIIHTTSERKRKDAHLVFVFYNAYSCFFGNCRWTMAPERPGAEDKPGVALVQRGGAVTIPVIPVFSLPNTLMHLKVSSVLWCAMWAGHCEHNAATCAAHIGDIRKYTKFDWETWRREVSLHNLTWEDNIKLNFKELGSRGVDRTYLAQCRVYWQVLVELVVNFGL